MALRGALLRRIVPAAAALGLVLGMAPAASAAEPVASTNAPTKIRVGAPYMEFPFSARTSGPASFMDVTLIDPRHGHLAWDYDSAENATSFSFRPDLYTWALPSYGKKTWVIAGYRDDTSQEIESRITTDLRAHSMTGFTSTRSGSTVTLRGSLRVYHNTAERYVAWTGQPISIQKKSGTSWIQIAGIQVDRRGNFTRTVSVPAGTTLRLVVKETATVWGAVSAARTV